MIVWLPVKVLLAPVRATVESTAREGAPLVVPPVSPDPEAVVIPVIVPVPGKVCDELKVTRPSNFAVPFTSRLALGVIVPTPKAPVIPKLPALLMLRIWLGVLLPAA